MEATRWPTSSSQAGRLFVPISHKFSDSKSPRQRSFLELKGHNYALGGSALNNEEKGNVTNETKLRMPVFLCAQASLASHLLFLAKEPG